MIIDLAKIYRGGEVESIHYGIVCLANTDSVIQSWGDAEFNFYTRSLIKPMQAKAMLDLGLDLHGKSLAIACASHNGLSDQVEAVEELMASYGISETDLKCGNKSNKRGELKSALYHNCSGKHSALIAASKMKSWDTNNYLDIDHPVQRSILNEVKRLTRLSDIVSAVDGCGIPTFYLSASQIAKAFAKLACDDSYLEIIKVMNQYPDLIGSNKQIDSIIMKNYPNKFIAKVGAEGSIVVVNLEKAESLVLKVIDGSSRVRPHIIASILENLGWVTKNSLALDHNIYNSHSEVVGEITVNDFE